MKKFLPMLLCIAIVLSVGMTNASAVSAPQAESTRGKLYDEEGNLVATIVGDRVSMSTICRAGGQEEISETYRFNVRSSIVNHQDSASSQDAYYCVTAYLTLTYRERLDEPSVYLLTNVSGSWTAPNDSRVSVSEAVLNYQCIGFGPDQLYTSWQTNQMSLNVSTRSFNVNTGFTNFIIPEFIACMGANLKLTLLMGNSRTWELYLEKYPIFNTDGVL